MQKTKKNRQTSCHDTSTGTGLTEHLQRWSRGDEASGKHVIELVYRELRRISGRLCMKGGRDDTLQPTAIVHETYIRLNGKAGMFWKNRAHFLGFASRVMRDIVIEYARRRSTLMRGGGSRHVALMEGISQSVAVSPEDLLALDDALRRLAKVDERKAKVVEALFFGGLSIKEAADCLEISRATVERQWRIAKAWLHRELNRKAGHG